MTERMAYLIDLDQPYITLDNNYIETVWWILDQFYKEDYIYEGHKILPYCTRCGTGLASHEVAQGYVEIKSQTVIAKFKRKDRNEHFLVWTTTPWTLPSNVALAVHPKETYVRVAQNDAVYIVEKILLQKVLQGDYEVLDEMLGETLEGVEYEQLLPLVEPDKKPSILYLLISLPRKMVLGLFTLHLLLVKMTTTSVENMTYLFYNPLVKMVSSLGPLGQENSLWMQI